MYYTIEYNGKVLVRGDLSRDEVDAQYNGSATVLAEHETSPIDGMYRAEWDGVKWIDALTLAEARAIKRSELDTRKKNQYADGVEFGGYTWSLDADAIARYTAAVNEFQGGLYPDGGRTFITMDGGTYTFTPAQIGAFTRAMYLSGAAIEESAVAHLSAINALETVSEVMAYDIA